MNNNNDAKLHKKAYPNGEIYYDNSFENDVLFDVAYGEKVITMLIEKIKFSDIKNHTLKRSSLFILMRSGDIKEYMIDFKSGKILFYGNSLGEGIVFKEKKMKSTKKNKSIIATSVAISAAVILAAISLVNSFMMQSRIDELEQIIFIQKEVIDIHTELLEKQAEINEDFLDVFQQIF